MRFKDLKEALLLQFQEEKRQIDQEYHDKETQIKVSTTIAIAAIEKKYMQQIKDIEHQNVNSVQQLNLNHEKSLRDLREVKGAQRLDLLNTHLNSF